MYPVPLDVQERELARDRRAIERAADVFDRLNVSKVKGGFALVLEQIDKGMPLGTGGGTLIYPPRAKAQAKQIRRDRRAIERAQDVAQRLGVYSGHDPLRSALAVIDRHEHALKQVVDMAAEAKAAQ